MADYEPSFYNDNWTVLQKIVYLSNWCKVNTIDINSISFAYTEPNESGEYTVTVSGKNYKGETVVLGTIPAYKGIRGEKGDQGIQGEKGDQGIQGEKGDQGSRITGITEGNSYVVGDQTVTPLTVTMSDAQPIQLLVCAKNGQKGADGNNFYIVGNLVNESQLPQNPERGESAYLVGETTPRNLYVYDFLTSQWTNQGTLEGVKGESGVGVDSIVALSHSVVGNETVTNLQVNYTEGKGPQQVEVHAANGTAGESGEPALLYTKIIADPTSTTTIGEDGTLQGVNALKPFSRVPKNDDYFLMNKITSQGNILIICKIISVISNSDTPFAVMYRVVDFSRVSDPSINITEVPSTATNGTFTDEQWEVLSAAPNTAYIMFYGEKFYPQDIMDNEGYRVYTHHGETDAKIETVKMIYVTTATKSWSMSVKKSTNLYVHNIELAMPSPNDSKIYIRTTSLLKDPINDTNEMFQFLGLLAPTLVECTGIIKINEKSYPVYAFSCINDQINAYFINSNWETSYNILTKSANILDHVVEV